ncbi:MAG: plasmid maintenance system killer protein [Acidimicrobiia bacterium]|nr:plasmid maintenance system killer protein [Acidimicrobiia bacterium]MYC57142.1 plasmid maintenance system killer protein [Acidimicrobiia bacterium]MYG93931.1 plasmid maintenance system killer protein [Acidimicrobiia bacterium]MYI29934.1 plasmid maintenance system killer protein [Acidimicrobiia bacterium]
MRLAFEDDNLRRLYEQRDFVLPRFGSDVTKAFRKKVGFLAQAESEADLRNYKALHFEKLKGRRAGQYSIRLNHRWRLILRIEVDTEGQLLLVVEIIDYH